MQRASVRQAGPVPACRVSDRAPGGLSGDARDRARLLAQLSAYYRELGWWVETAADADADLCLRRDRDVLLLRAMSENDGSFDADAMRRFVDAIGRAGAGGGLAVGCAGFDDDAVAAAPASVRRLDAAALHGMFGALPARPAHGDPFAEAHAPVPRADVRPASARLPAWTALATMAVALAAALACVAYAGLRLASAG